MNEKATPGRKIVVFDFDGTLTRSDTLLRLAIYRHGYLRFLWKMIRILPVLLLHFARLYPNQRTKERFLKVFFGNLEQGAFDSLCRAFAREVLPSLIRGDAIACLEEHKAKGDRVLVITASAENWVRPWCESVGVECVASRMDVKDGKITGYLKGRNCYGEEKIVRLKEITNPDDFASLIVYGDSRGDLPLGRIAGRFQYKKFTG